MSENFEKSADFFGIKLEFFSMSFEFYKNVQKKPNLFLTKTNFKRDANAGFLNVQFRLFRLQRLQVQVPQLQLQLPPKHSRHWCGKLARGSATTRSKVRLILPLTVTKNRIGLERCYKVFVGLPFWREESWKCKAIITVLWLMKWYKVYSQKK